VSSEQIEDVMSMLSEMGINIIENDEAEEGEAKGGEVVEVSTSREIAVATSAVRDARPHRRPRAHVPARDGLGRAPVARGRDRHRQAHRGRPQHDDRGPLRKPADLPGHHDLARRASVRGHLLRDVIDLEATFGRSMGDDDERQPGGRRSRHRRRRPRRGADGDEPELDADGEPIRREEDEEDDEQANMSLAAMEAALKPRVLETLDRIARDYGSWPRCRTSACRPR
jgi:RNA polymerase primary sigma factor